MAVPKRMNPETPDGSEVPQLKLLGLVFMFTWPTAWYFLLIYVLLQPFVPDGGIVPTWVFLLGLVLGTSAEGLAGLFLLRREGYPLRLNRLRDRLRWRWPQGKRAWGTAVGVLILGMALSMMAGPLNKALAGAPGFVPPPWWPPASNPLVKVSGPADVFPDIQLLGNFGFVLLYFLIGLVCNIFGEEIYYRGYLLPRMRGVCGRWDWVVNGIGFTLKHFYQRWMYPGVLIGGLAFAFAAGPLGSLPLAMVYHWVGNFLFNIVFLVLAAFGAG